MNLKDFTELGYYEPVFLHINLNTEEDIFDLNQLLGDDEEKVKLFSTFLHEYIHFLQNITTTHGLMTSIFYIDLIKDINWTVRNDDKPEFDVPVEINNYNNVKANFELQQIYKGDGKGSAYIKYEYYEIEEVEVTDKNGNVSKPKKYKINFIDLNTRQYKSIYFGATCIKEYMAHTIQQKFLPTIEHPDIPYLIAELIVEKEYPPLASNKMFIVALCDASLMCLHPAQMFFNTLDRMKTNGFIPNSIIDIYDFCFYDLKFTGQDGEFTTKGLFDMSIELANKQFNDALKSEIFKPNNIWMKHIFDKAKELRENYIHFITDLISDDGKLTETLVNLFHLFGTPFYTNKKGKGGFIPPTDLKALDIQSYQLLTFKEVINIYFGLKSCSLYNFCKQRHDKDITNDKCKEAPWERATEPELCPLGQIWKTWGLIGETPKHKSKT